MALAVRQIEITDGIPDMRVPDDYSGLMLIISFLGTPLGDFCIKANTSIVSSEYLREQIVLRYENSIMSLWLKHQITPKDDYPGSEALPPVDVIICTSGDKPDELRRCLRSISDISYPEKSVILVDNGLDNETTYAIAHEYGARYVIEKKRGLDFARNKGLQAATSDFVLFTDDDVVVDQMWIHKMVKAFESDKSLSCVVGLTLPLEIETAAQEMFDVRLGGMKRGYQRRIYSRFDLPSMAAPTIGAGANMAFRSAVFKQIGGFDEAMDCGTPARAGGDIEMFYRMLMRGYKVCYDPEIVVRHRHRRNMDELHNQLSGYATSLYVLLTKCVLEYHDLSAIPVGLSCFRRYYLHDLLRGLLGKATKPLSITLGEIRGAMRGPIAFFKARSYVSKIRLQEGSERRGRHANAVSGKLNFYRMKAGNAQRYRTNS